MLERRCRRRRLRCGRRGGCGGLLIGQDCRSSRWPVLQPVHERLFDVALRDPLDQSQVLEHVRVLDQLLPELGVRCLEHSREVRRRGIVRRVQSSLDLVL